MMAQQFKVGDVVYVKDQDSGGEYLRTVEAVERLFTSPMGSVSWIVKAGEAWRPQERLALYVKPKPTYTVNTQSGMFVRALTKNAEVIASVERGTVPDSEAIKHLRALTEALGYERAD